MKKIYNIILIVLIIAILIVGSMIYIKYHSNHLNEVNISNTIITIERKLENFPEGEKLQETFEGYNIDGILEIPKIDIKYPIINETNKETMKLSITKFWGPEINEIGNYTIAGHNNLDGTLFGKTKKLECGDIIKITDLRNHTVNYQIFKIYLVDPNDVSIVNSVNIGKREITLITCSNGRKQRLITKAVEI